MEQFQLLKVIFGDKIIIDTYNHSVIDCLITELKKNYQTDRIFLNKSENGWASISTKKKDNIRISEQYILHLIGMDGWEPYSVDHEHDSYFFRKRTVSGSNLHD